MLCARVCQNGFWARSQRTWKPGSRSSRGPAWDVRGQSRICRKIGADSLERRGWRSTPSGIVRLRQFLRLFWEWIAVNFDGRQCFLTRVRESIIGNCATEISSRFGSDRYSDVLCRIFCSRSERRAGNGRIPPGAGDFEGLIGCWSSRGNRPIVTSRRKKEELPMGNPNRVHRKIQARRCFAVEERNLNSQRVDEIEIH